jgi:nucleoside-diphosphate-sugar epimerase
MTQRRVLVTGAGGFVGRALASGFADRGWDVIALDRAFDVGWTHHGVRPVTADLGEGVPRGIPEVDLVVHAAWVTTDPTTLRITAAEYAAWNVHPLLAVLEHAGRTCPSAFVFVSSSGVFAPTDGAEGLTDADHATGTSPYASAKRTGESLVSSALDPTIAAHVVRLGYLFGPGEAVRASRTRLSLVAGWIAAAREGRPLEVRADDPVRDWTFTADLAPALERLVAGSPAGRPVHLGSPCIYRDRTLAALIADRFPGAEVVTVPAGEPVKPPMVPSDIPALRDFVWTDAASGLRTLLAAEVAA